MSCSHQVDVSHYFLSLESEHVNVSGTMSVINVMSRYQTKSQFILFWSLSEASLKNNPKVSVGQPIHRQYDKALQTLQSWVQKTILVPTQLGWLGYSGSPISRVRPLCEWPNSALVLLGFDGFMPSNMVHNPVVLICHLHAFLLLSSINFYDSFLIICDENTNHPVWMKTSTVEDDCYIWLCFSTVHHLYYFQEQQVPHYFTLQHCSQLIFNNCSNFRTIFTSCEDLLNSAVLPSFLLVTPSFTPPPPSTPTRPRDTSLCLEPQDLLSLQSAKTPRKLTTLPNLNLHPMLSPAPLMMMIKRG